MYIIILLLLYYQWLYMEIKLQDIKEDYSKTNILQYVEWHITCNLSSYIYFRFLIIQI